MKTESFDVVVVGGGGAGLAAAIEAATAGASTCLLEKAPYLRGSTGWSVGSVSAAGTDAQKRLGITDSADAHFEDFRKFYSGQHLQRENWELIRLLVDQSKETFDWLQSLGLNFVGPFLEAPHLKPRLHVVVPGSMAYLARLSRRATKLGVAIRLGTAATRLAFDGSRVTGVHVKDGSGERCIHAARAVVLAAGDFSNSPELKRKFCSEEDATFPALNVWNTGDAIRMAMDIGAGTRNADLQAEPNIRLMPPARAPMLARLPALPFLTKLIQLAWDTLPASVVRPMALKSAMTATSPALAMLRSGGIATTLAGDLLEGKPGKLGRIIAARASEGAYFILDGKLIDKFSAPPHFVSTAPGLGFAYLPDYRKGRKDVYREAGSIAALAAKLGMDEKRLDAAVQRAGHAGMPLGDGPYAALGPMRSMTVITDGGLKVSTGMQVLRSDDSPIANLYAAGATGQGGTFLFGHGHHLGWAFTSGRIAGRNAATAGRV